MSLTLYVRTTLANGNVIKLPASFKKVRIFQNSWTEAQYCIIKQAGKIDANHPALEIEAPVIGGHSPITLDVVSVNGSPSQLNFLIEEIGQTADENYWKIESVDPDGTLHYEGEKGEA